MIVDIEKIITEYKKLCDKGTEEDYEYITIQATGDIENFIREIFTL